MIAQNYTGGARIEPVLSESRQLRLQTASSIFSLHLFWYELEVSHLIFPQTLSKDGLFLY